MKDKWDYKSLNWKPIELDFTTSTSCKHFLVLQICYIFLIFNNTFENSYTCVCVCTYFIYFIMYLIYTTDLLFNILQIGIDIYFTISYVLSDWSIIMRFMYIKRDTLFSHLTSYYQVDSLEWAKIITTWSNTYYGIFQIPELRDSA